MFISSGLNFLFIIRKIVAPLSLPPADSRQFFGGDILTKMTRGRTRVPKWQANSLAPGLRAMRGAEGGRLWWQITLQVVIW